MSEMRQRALKGLKAGDVFTVTRTLTGPETEAFGDLTRDYNPVHYDPEFARASGFSGLICHGLLVGGLVCEIGGQVGWLATSMNFRYLKPVYLGQTVTCTLEVISVDHRQRARARADIVTQEGVKVLEVEMTGRLTAGPRKKAMEEMVAQGDPTNKLAGS
jgi:acyl dehydratase